MGSPLLPLPGPTPLLCPACGKSLAARHPDGSIRIALRGGGDGYRIEGTITAVSVCCGRCRQVTRFAAHAPGEMQA